MSNANQCTSCNKTFTCGCQKARGANGEVLSICKSCQLKK